MSSTSRWKQIALDPAGSRTRSASNTTDGTSQRASSSAVVRPTGPPPTMSTGSTDTLAFPSVLQLGPDRAVALRGPDDRPLDAGQLVPQPGHVERQAVLEDRPAAEGRRERGVRRGERVLERAAPFVHRAGLAQHRVEEGPALPDRGRDRGAAVDD